LNNDINIIEVSDIHINKKWITKTKEDIEHMAEIGRIYKIDAFFVSGDTFDTPPIASNKSSFDKMLEIGEMMQEVAQVYYIVGTPGHEDSGCYEAFKRIGWIESTIGTIHKIKNLLLLGMPEINPQNISARFPEFTRQELISKQYELVDQIIEEFYAPVATDHVGPVHFMGHGHVSGAKFRDDQKPRTSEFMFSEQMLSKIGANRYQFGHLHLPQEFNTINGGYVGSVHTSWNEINFVPGFNLVTYSTNGQKIERFNFKTLEKRKVKIRNQEGFVALLEKNNDYDSTNLHIEVICDKEFAKTFDSVDALKSAEKALWLGPESKLTLSIAHDDKARIDADSYDLIKNTEDLYKIYDPEASPSVLTKIKELEESLIESAGPIKTSCFEFVELVLKGSIINYENGVDEIRMDFQEFQAGVNLLTGQNGTGKSFSLGFCSPYSKHLPTGEDLKSLFLEKDSSIIRKFRDGSDIITQKIFIDPTLASPTAKYFMDVNGVPVEECKGNKGPFDKVVDEMFGSIKMFVSSVFRGQKENKQVPSLESASESDLRDIYTELAGKDRGPWKESANNKSKQLKRDNDLDTRELEILESQKKDVSEIKKGIESKEKILEFDKSSLNNFNTRLTILERNKNDFDAIKEKNNSIINEVNELIVQASKEKTLGEDAKSKQLDIEFSLKDPDEVKKEISTLKGYDEKMRGLETELITIQKTDQVIYEAWKDETSLINIELDKIKEDGESAKSKSDKKRKEIDEKLNAIDLNISKINTELIDFHSLITTNEERVVYTEKRIIESNKPCEKCGELSDVIIDNIKEDEKHIVSLKAVIQKTIESIDLAVLRLENLKTHKAEILKSTELNELESIVEGLRVIYEETRATIKPAPKDDQRIEALKKEISVARVVTPEELTALEDQLKSFDDLTKKALEFERVSLYHVENILVISAKLKALNESAVEFDQEGYAKTLQNIDIQKGSVKTAQESISNMKASIIALENQVKEEALKDLKISAVKSRLKMALRDISDWQEIEKAFSPKGIPALEISLATPIIDDKANEILKHYGERFKVRTITQALDSTGKNLVEKFKILVSDNRSQEEKNLPNLSGGQLAWITWALRESLSDFASSHSGKSWLYGIEDESDSAIDTVDISRFYDMVERSVKTGKKLVAVTHSSEAKEAIRNQKEISDFFINKGEK